MSCSLVYKGVTSHDYWRLAYGGWNSKTQQRDIVLSVPMHWGQLTEWERTSFQMRPLEMPSKYK